LSAPFLSRGSGAGVRSGRRAQSILVTKNVGFCRICRPTQYDKFQHSIASLGFDAGHVVKCEIVCALNALHNVAGAARSRVHGH